MYKFKENSNDEFAVIIVNLLNSLRNIYRWLTDWLVPLFICCTQYSMMDKITLRKVDKKVMMRNRYNRIPHPAKDTKRESYKDISRSQV